MELVKRLAPTMPSVSYRERTVGAPTWHLPSPLARALPSAQLAARDTQLIAAVVPLRVSMLM